MRLMSIVMTIFVFTSVACDKSKNAAIPQLTPRPTEKTNTSAITTAAWVETEEAPHSQQCLSQHTTYHPVSNLSFDTLWAQKAVDGDLMFDAMSEIRHARIKSGHKVNRVKVAVVDDGYNKALTDLLDVNGIEILQVNKDVPDPQQDTQGHGLSVASVISGKNCVGIAPGVHMRIYGVAIKNSPHGISDQAKLESIRHACKSGYKIINASNGPFNNIFAPAIEEQYRELISELQTEGCVLFNSAGNGGTDNSHYMKQSRLDDAYVRIGATRRTGGIALLTDKGEFYAPGEAVFTYNYAESLQYAKLGHFTNGTSFSSPLITAIGSQIYEVLSYKDEFHKIPGVKQIQLISNILVAASGNGYNKNISGLKAVLAAHHLNFNAAKNLPSIEEISKSLTHNTLSFCSSSLKNSVDERQIRKQLALCKLTKEELLQIKGNIKNEKPYSTLVISVNALLAQIPDALPLANIPHFEHVFNEKNSLTITEKIDYAILLKNHFVSEGAKLFETVWALQFRPGQLWTHDYIGTPDMEDTAKAFRALFESLPEDEAHVFFEKLISSDITLEEQKKLSMLTESLMYASVVPEKSLELFTKLIRQYPDNYSLPADAIRLLNRPGLKGGYDLLKVAAEHPRAKKAPESVAYKEHIRYWTKQALQHQLISENEAEAVVNLISQ